MRRDGSFLVLSTQRRCKNGDLIQSREATNFVVRTLGAEEW